jgi:hypothetical protein
MYNFSYTIQSGDEEGAYYGNGWGKDTGGAPGTCGPTQLFTVDQTPPNAFTPTASYTVYEGLLYACIQFTTTDAISGVQSYKYAIDSGNYTSCGSPWYIDVTDWTDGAYTVHVKAIDRVGNETVGDVVLYRERTAPALTIVDTNPSEATGGESVSITFDSDEMLQSNPIVTVNGDQAAYSSCTANGPNYTYVYEYEIPYTAEPGPATIEITGSDCQNNTGSVSTDTALTILGLNISDLSNVPDDTEVRLTDKIVTLGSTSIGSDYCIYLTEPIGPVYHTEGIRVVTSSSDLVEKDGVTIIGELDTDADGERVILASSVDVTSQHRAIPIQRVNTLAQITSSVGRRVSTTGTVMQVDQTGGYYVLDANNTPTDTSDDFKVAATSPDSGNLGKSMFFTGVVTLETDETPAVLPSFSHVNDVTLGNPGTPGYVGPSCAYFGQSTAFDYCDYPIGSSPYGIFGNAGRVLILQVLQDESFEALHLVTMNSTGGRNTINELRGGGIGEVVLSIEPGPCLYFFGDNWSDPWINEEDYGYYRKLAGSMDTFALPNGYYQLTRKVLLDIIDNRDPWNPIISSASFLEPNISLSVDNMILTPLIVDWSDQWGVKVVSDVNQTQHIQVQLSDAVYNDETVVTAYIYPIPARERNYDDKWWHPIKTIVLEHQTNNGVIDIPWNPSEDNIGPGVYGYIVLAQHGEAYWSEDDVEWDEDTGALTAFRVPAPYVGLPGSYMDEDATVGHWAEPGPLENQSPYLPFSFRRTGFGYEPMMIPNEETMRVAVQTDSVTQPQGGPATVSITYNLIDTRRDASECELVIIGPSGTRLYPTSTPTLDTARGQHTVSFDFYPIDGQGKYYFLICAKDSYAYCERGHRNKSAGANGDKATYVGGTNWVINY